MSGEKGTVYHGLTLFGKKILRGEKALSKIRTVQCNEVGIADGIKLPCPRFRS